MTFEELRAENLELHRQLASIRENFESILRNRDKMEELLEKMSKPLITFTRSAAPDEQCAHESVTQSGNTGDDLFCDDCGERF
jgi:hypothetical protein